MLKTCKEGLSNKPKSNSEYKIIKIVVGVKMRNGWTDLKKSEKDGNWSF